MSSLFPQMEGNQIFHDCNPCHCKHSHSSSASAAPLEAVESRSQRHYSINRFVPMTGIYSLFSFHPKQINSKKNQNYIKF